MSQDIVAQRVRRVLRESGLSQSEFAARAGLDASKMSKSLSGVRRFSSLDLARIAELGRVTVDWLLGSDVGTPALAARATRPLTESVELAVREATRFAQVRADLAFLGYAQSAVEFEVTRSSGMLVGQGAQLATLAAEHARKAGHDPTHGNLAEAIEAAFGVDVGVVALPDGFDGLAWRDAHTRLIVVGTSGKPGRQRFSMAHELGHLLARDDQELCLDADIMAPAHRRDRSEMRANAFAAAFLMPEDTLREAAPARWSESSFAELSCRLSVSPSALAWRLHNLGLLDTSDRDRFVRIPGAQAAQLAGRVGWYAEWIEEASLARTPRSLIRDTFRAYREGKATLRPFASLVGMDVSALRSSVEDVTGEPAFVA